MGELGVDPDERKSSRRRMLSPAAIINFTSVDLHYVVPLC